MQLRISHPIACYTCTTVSISDAHLSRYTRKVTVSIEPMVEKTDGLDDYRFRLQLEDYTILNGTQAYTV